MEPRTIIVVVATLGLIGTAGARWGRTIKPDSPPSMAQALPSASTYDIDGASLSTSGTPATKRYSVTIPATAPLEDGTFLVRLLLGNPAEGRVERIVYGLYGPGAHIEGYFPMKGTTGGILAGDDTYLSAANAYVSGNDLRLEVAPSDIDGQTLIKAEVYEVDSSNLPAAGETPLWELSDSKTLVYNVTAMGTFLVPPIPGDPIPDDDAPLHRLGSPSVPTTRSRRNR